MFLLSLALGPSVASFLAVILEGPDSPCAVSTASALALTAVVVAVAAAAVVVVPGAAFLAVSDAPVTGRLGAALSRPVVGGAGVVPGILTILGAVVVVLVVVVLPFDCPAVPGRLTVAFLAVERRPLVESVLTRGLKLGFLTTCE